MGYLVLLDRLYIEQIRAALIVIAGCGFLIFMGWLTTSERHGLSGILLGTFCYGLPAAVLGCWLQPYVAMLARGLKRRLTMPTTQRGRRMGSAENPCILNRSRPPCITTGTLRSRPIQFSWRADGS